MSPLSTPGRSRTGDQVAQKTSESGTNTDGCEGYGSITPALLARNAPESCAESATKVQSSAPAPDCRHDVGAWSESVAGGGCDLNTSRPRTTPASAWGCAS